MNDFVMRRVPRYPVNLQVLEVNGQPASGCCLLDISAMGALVEATFPVLVSEAIKLAFVVPDKGERRVEGKVEWVRPAYHKEGYYLMGVSFVDPNWEYDQLGQEMFFS